MTASAPTYLRTLFLHPPSYQGFDGGAGSRYQARREIRSFWYPTWLAQPAATAVVILAGYLAEEHTGAARRRWLLLGAAASAIATLYVVSGEGFTSPDGSGANRMAWVRVRGWDVTIRHVPIWRPSETGAASLPQPAIPPESRSLCSDRPENGHRRRDAGDRDHVEERHLLTALSPRARNPAVQRPTPDGVSRKALKFSGNPQVVPAGSELDGLRPAAV